MLLRISLIFAILAGIGTIVVTQLKTREHVQGIIAVREENIQGRAKEKGRADKAEKDLGVTRKDLKETKDVLTKTEEELTGTKQQLAAAQDNIGKLKGDLAKAVEARNTSEAELSKWAQLGVKPEQVRDMIASNTKLKDAIAALDDEKKILERRVAELQNKVALLLGDEYVVELPAGTKGKIVAVDPKWNFVVLDVGSDKGMLEGGILLVHRNSQLVGKVRISEVLANRSIAAVMKPYSLGEIEEGDQVLY